MKKITKLLTLFVGLLCVMTASASVAGTNATNYDLTIAGTRVTSDNASDVLGNGVFSYEVYTNTLYINGSYTENSKRIVESFIPNLTVVINSDAVLTSNNQAVLVFRQSASITGNGKLTLKSPNECGIYVTEEASLTIYDADDIDIQALWGIAGPRTSTVEKVTIKNTNVTITASGSNNSDAAAICDLNGGLELVKCEITAPEGAYFDIKDLKAQNGSIAKDVTISRVVITPVPGEDLIAGGDFEGDYSALYANQSSVVDYDSDGNHFIAITSVDASDDWDTQFFIKLSRPLVLDETLVFSMRAKANRDATIASIALNSDMLFQQYNFFGDFGLTSEWQTFTREITVDSNLDGAQGISFFLNKDHDSAVYYFDDLSLKVPGPVVVVINGINYSLDPSTHEAMVLSHSYSGDIIVPPTVNFGGTTYNVTAVNDSSFRSSGITSVTLPEGLTTIGSGVFGAGVSTVFLPSTLTTMGESPFSQCGALTTVYCYAETPPTYSVGVISADNSTTLYVPAGCGSLYENDPGWSVFSNIVEMVEPFDALIGDINYRLDPNTQEATVIYKWRYSGDITIPASVSFEGVTYDVMAIENYAFTGMDLTSITLPEGLTTIGDGAFGNNESLTTVTLPSTLTNVGSSIFYQSSNLETVYCYATTPPTLADGKVIPTPNSATLYVPEGCVGSYEIAAGWSGFSNIVEMVEPFETLIGNINYRLDPSTHEATVIWKWRYSGDVTVPASVSFEDVTYDVKAIENYAFTGMDLTSITLPEGLTTIGDGAFSSNASLTSVTLPSTLTNVGSFIFYHSSHLETVYCYATTPPVLADGTIISTPNTAMLFVPEGSVSAYQNAPGWQDFNAVYGTVTIVNATIDGINYEIDLRNQTAEVVGNWTTGYSGDITIPSSVTYDGVTYPVTAVRGYSFVNSAITSVTVSEGLTTIGDGAFSSCLSLTTVSLPSTLTSVGQYLFMGMPSDDMVLESVYCYATTPPVVVGEGSINMIPGDNTATLYVPAGSLSAYQNAPGWSQFSNIVEMGSSPSGPELIVNGDFEGTDMSAFSGQQLGGGSFNRYDFTTDNIASWEGDGNHFLYAFFSPVDINESTGEPWAYQDQLIIKLNGSLAPGDHFRFSMRAKNTGGAITINGHGNNGSVWNLLGEFNLTDEWQTFEVEGVVDETLSNDITKLELYLPVTDYSMGNFMFDDFSLKKVVETIPGDVNGDNEVDVADFTLLANYLLGKSPAGFNVEAADVAGGPGGAPDGSIDIADLTGIANIILHSHSGGE